MAYNVMFLSKQLRILKEATVTIKSFIVPIPTSEQHQFIEIALRAVLALLVHKRTSQANTTGRIDTIRSQEATVERVLELFERSVRERKSFVMYDGSDDHLLYCQALSRYYDDLDKRRADEVGTLQQETELELEELKALMFTVGLKPPPPNRRKGDPAPKRARRRAPPRPRPLPTRSHKRAPKRR